MLSDFTRGLAATLGGDLAAGQVLLRDVTEQISCPPIRDDPRSLLFLALASGFLGDPRVAMAVGSSQLSQVRNRGALGVLVPALALFAAGRAWLGDHAGAFADAGEASELGDQLGYAADTAIAVESCLAVGGPWSSRGRSQRAPRAKSLTDRAGTTGFAAHQALTAAFCALCRSDPAAIVSLLEARIAADGGVGSMGEPLGVAPYLVEAYVALGRRDEAIAVTEQFELSPPRRHRHGCGRWWRGVERSPPTTKRPLEKRSIPPSPRTPSRPIRSRPPARISCTAPACAAAANASRRGNSCVPLTTPSRGWISRPGCFMPPTNLPPRGQTAHPPTTADEPLTSQETRVALHAAKGMSNKEIAAALVLSPKTVEHHLSSVYRKRGFRSRAALARAFRPREDG